MEEAIWGDYALIKAWRADKLGNIQFRFSQYFYLLNNVQWTSIELALMLTVAWLRCAVQSLSSPYWVIVKKFNGFFCRKTIKCDVEQQISLLMQPQNAYSVLRSRIGPQRCQLHQRSQFMRAAVIHSTALQHIILFHSTWHVSLRSWWTTAGKAAQRS